MGEESLNALKETWNAMKTGYDEAEWEQGEGVILGLMAQGYLDRDIKAFLGVGRKPYSPSYESSTSRSIIRRSNCIH
jgi:hypothetical protein